jgi:dTMP kinase
MNPFFITFEGIDGAGKSTHINFVEKYLQDNHIPFISTREPGGTPLGEKLRNHLLNDDMDPCTETLLMFSSRMEHIKEIIKPNLDKGLSILSDRFTDATYAYQHGGKGVNEAFIHELKTLVHPNINPNITFLFDCPIEISLERLHSTRDLDKFEKEEKSFHQKVRDAYLTLAKAEPNRFVIIDSSQTIETIQIQIEQSLDKLFHNANS